MAKITNNLITTKDFFVHGREKLLLPTPCSPYRYIEFLIEHTVQKKFGLRRAIEVGPGTDPGLQYLDTASLDAAAAVDFVPEALEIAKKKVRGIVFDAHAIDIMAERDYPQFKEKYDYVICNSVIEHVIDDQHLVDVMYDMLAPGGVIVCSTVMHQFLYCSWDYAVGHYRRYSAERLETMFERFSEVQIAQTSLLQELVRPFFFSRIYPLCGNTIEHNNTLSAIGHQEWGKAPYAPIWPLLKLIMPMYLAFDWIKSGLPGGIGFVIARK